MLKNSLLNKRKSFINANNAALVLLLAIAADIIAVQFVLGSAILSIATRYGQENNFYLNMMLNVLIQVSFLTVILIFLRKNKLAFSPIPKDLSPKRIQSTLIVCLIGIAAIAVCLVSFYGLAIIFDFLLREINYSSPIGIEFYGTGETAMVIFAVVIAAPICEELLFRGVLLSGMKKSGYHDLTCVLLSGVSFSLMHMNPDQTIYQFCIGCAMAFITLKTKSLIPAIIMHSANNLFAILMVSANITILDDIMTWMFSTNLLSVVMPIVFAIAGAVAIFFMGKLCQKVLVYFHPDESIEPALADEQPAEETPSPNHFQNNQYGYNPYMNNQQVYNPYMNMTPPHGYTSPMWQQNGQPQNPYVQQQNGQPQNPYAQQQNGQPFFYTPYPYYYQPPYRRYPQKKFDPRGNRFFSIFFGISLAVCATLWMMMLAVGLLM